MNNIILPTVDLSQLTSAMANIPTVDFSKFQSVFADIPQIPIPEISSTIAEIQKINFPQFQSTLMSVSKINFPEIASVLANIPQPVFNIQEIVAPIHAMVERAQLVNESLAQALQAPLLQMAESTQSLLSSIDFSLLIYRKEWSKQRETLLKYGWFYLDELPNELINEIHEKRDELTANDVDEIIVGYFRQDRCKELKRIVKSWNNLTYFYYRAAVFHEALVNHSRRYFNTSTTLLIVHTEGVITDFVRLRLQNPRFRVKRALEDIKKELDNNEELSIYEYEVFGDIIERIEDAFNEGFEHSNPDKASNQSRDKIAHGHAYEKESEVNSLKQFLYLNEIYHLFSLLTIQE